MALPALDLPRISDRSLLRHLSPGRNGIELNVDPALDYGSTSYKQAYGRLTGAVIE
ncbi:MAG: hypothetical protein HC824_17705, partial [Synechococcales cyanobacterium RM1_1_8]|nr:hypothetical protein [Synechococcales cyanobacterium RM1_1_8]